MKKLYIIFLFSTLSLYVNAQDNLDSLWNVWNNESQADTTRLEAIHVFLHGGKDREFSRSEALSQDLDSAFSLCEQMSNLAKSGGHKKYLVYSLRIKGGYLKLVNDSEQRIELFEQALEIASELKDERLIILSSMTLGYGFLDTNDLILAEENFRIALSLIELETFISEGSTSKIDPELSSYAGMAFMGLARVMEAQRNYEQSTEYLQQAVLLAGQSNMVSMLEESMGRLGAAFEREKKYLKAIKFFSKSLKLAEQKGDKHWIAHNLGSLGHLYTQVGEYTKAQDYLFHALTSMQEAGPIHSSEQLNIVELLAMNYREQKNYSKALEYDSIMLKLAEEFNPAYFPIAMIHFAMDFYELGDYTNALEHGFRTLEMNEEYVSRASNFIRNSVFILIGKTYGKQGQFAKAITWCEKTDKDLPIEYEKEICECLYEAHKGLKHGNEALSYHERFLVLSDSLNTEELAKNLQQMEFREQVLVDSLATVEEKRLVEEAHQEEVLAKEKQRNIFMGSGLLVLLLSGGLWSRLRFIRKSRATLQVEKDRSENLLLNILPAEVAEELKANGKAQARDFEMVSILFTDFKEFTQTSEKLSAAELVGEINHCFEGFDAIMEKYGVEKIKTIGDAYMAAGGLPVSTPESPLHTVQAALEMCEFVANRKSEREAEGKIGFEMRCGIHTGPVVAGIVGVKKFQYDIWGDTVNTASRMESNSEVGKVNISQDTYELIKNETALSFEKRSKIEVKGKGEMEMYFVT